MFIGIIGNGFVGKATFQLKCKDIDVLAYDINPDQCVPAGLTLEEMKMCEIIFVSVPTPMSKDGSCHLNIVRSVIADLKKVDYTGTIILRSTVPVGTSDGLKCYFMPEFLTEKNFINDFINNKKWIIGLLAGDDGHHGQVKESVNKLFTLAQENDRIKHNDVCFMCNKEAEMVKMFRNCFLAAKVSFCNEIYDYCQKKGVDYENMIQVAAADDRIGTGHTLVPGHDGMRGFGGTCFPKDSSSLLYEMTQSGMESYIMRSVTERNNNVDRVEQDWKQDKGRAAVDE